MIVFGESRYSKYTKRQVNECWKELRCRFLPYEAKSEDVEKSLLKATSQIRSDYTFDQVSDLPSDHNTLGEFALEQLHWAKNDEQDKSVEPVAEDEWKSLAEPILSLSMDDQKMEEDDEGSEKKKMVVRHTRRNRQGMSLSPNILGFSLAQVRLFCQQIRLAKQLKSDVIVHTNTNTTIADFAIRYLCNVQFKRTLSRQK
jgi:hypothetical protein